MTNEQMINEQMTNDRVYLAALAGLLHDVGKFAQRAGWQRGKHAEVGGEFVRQYVPEQWREYLYPVMGHHDRPLQGYETKVVALADRLSAASVAIAVVLCTAFGIGFYLGRRAGDPLLGVAASYSLTMVFIVFPPYLWFALGTVGVRGVDWLRELRPAARGTLAMGLIVAACHWLLGDVLQIHDALLLAVEIPLGVLLYEMVAGRPPFDGTTTVALYLAKRGNDFPRLREVAPKAPRKLEKLVADLLRYEADERPGSAQDVLARLS